MDPEAPNAASADATDWATTTNYILVQTNHPLSDANVKELEDRGATILEYVPESTYICRYNPVDLSPVRALSFVNWAGVYLQQFKIAPELQRIAERPSVASVATLDVETSMAQQPRSVTVVLHRDVDPEAVRSDLAAVASEVRKAHVV